MPSHARRAARNLPLANGQPASSTGHERAARRERHSCRRRLLHWRRHSLALTRPGNCVGNVLLRDPEPGEFVAHFIQTAAPQRLERDRIPIRADVEVFHPAEACGHRFGNSELVFSSQFGKHDRLKQGYKDTRKSYHKPASDCFIQRKKAGRACALNSPPHDPRSLTPDLLSVTMKSI